MKITVIGAGAIGGLIGAYLAKGGCDVLLLNVNQKNVTAVNEHGMKIITIKGTQIIPVKADTVEHFLKTNRDMLECVLLCVKAQFTKSAIEPFLPFMSENSFVVSVQNGLCEYNIADVVGLKRTVSGFVNIFSDYIEPGVINYGGKGALVIGEMDGKMTPRLEQIRKSFIGLDSLEISNNVLGYLWGKLGYANILAATSLTNTTMADVIDNPKYRVMLMDLASEVLEVATQKNIHLVPFDDWNPDDAYPRIGRDLDKMNKQLDIHVRRLRTYTKVHSGIWRDIAVRHRKTEMHAQLTPVIDMGKQLGVDLPLTQLNLNLLDEVQDGKREFSEKNLDVLLTKDIELYHS